MLNCELILKILKLCICDTGYWLVPLLSLCFQRKCTARTGCAFMSAALQAPCQIWSTACKFHTFVTSGKLAD